MRNVWVIGLALVFVVCVAGIYRKVARWFWRRGRRPVTMRPLRRGPGAFDANPWPDAPVVVPPREFHRPADIDLTDPQILPPPREIRGRYGE
jgi:hypothetical protein